MEMTNIKQNHNILKGFSQKYITSKHNKQEHLTLNTYYSMEGVPNGINFACPKKMMHFLYPAIECICHIKDTSHHLFPLKR